MVKKFLNLLRILISFGLLGLLFWIMRKDVQSIITTISSCNFIFLFFAAFLIIVNVLMLSIRLKTVFHGENLFVNLNKSIQLTLLGYYFNNFMPTAVGGDIIKGHYATVFTGNQRLKSYASVLMDRFIGLYTYLVVAAVALVINRGVVGSVLINYIIYFILFIGIIGVFVVTNKSMEKIISQFFLKFKMLRIGERLNSVYNIVHDYRNRPGVVFQSFLLSVISQMIYYSAIYLFFISLGYNIDVGTILLIMPVVTFISMVPSIGGLGVREGAMVAFFAPLAGKDIAFAVSLLVLFGLFFISILGGIVYIYLGLKGVADDEG